MEHLNEYRVILDTALSDQGSLVHQKGAGIILERSDEGIVHIWPSAPTFHNEQSKDLSAENHQDYENYVIDGDWAVKEPWRYFYSLDEVMDLLNKSILPLEFRDLSWLHSIREARALVALMHQD